MITSEAYLENHSKILDVLQNSYMPLSVKQIANITGISHWTVRSHLKDIDNLEKEYKEKEYHNSRQVKHTGCWKYYMRKNG